MSSLLALLATPLIMACPGASASIAIEDPQMGSVELAFCNPQQCTEAIAKATNGETVILKEAIASSYDEDYEVVTKITRSPDNDFIASVQFPDAAEPEILKGQLVLGSGLRGGCGSDIEYITQFPAIYFDGDKG
ncbi:MAG: hypothetical protein SAJ12_08305 [Jaaginema sp. PMC 1079.18]|nr:hypothetical protein [Jaaginema sp. PMC 1080.18]MEC4850999.1 hypothetical protein [Jaaginema sp. PMC 1079.18]MEC4867752.1 hypothetical protein [Jaaginema sp. PMC 1078.18]